MALIKKQDYINSFKLIKSDGGDVKIQEKEANHIIEAIMKTHVLEFFNKLIYEHEEKNKKNLDKIFQDIEGRLLTYIDFKTTKMCETICEAIITRKFNEEVEKKAKELLLKRGKF